MGIVSSGRLELEKVLDEVDGCDEISSTESEVNPPSRGALGTIAWKGCLACLLKGVLSWISGCGVSASSLYVESSAELLTEFILIWASVFSLGVPTIFMIWTSWSLLSRPRNRGYPVIISAKLSVQPRLARGRSRDTHMQPTLQMSMLVL